MGILKRDASAKAPRSAVTIIAQGNKFSGEMNIVGKMHIDGIFEGTIASLDSISIGKRGEVRGQIKAHQINVSGLLEGEIHCEELHIESEGRVHGVVHSQEMVIDRRGSFTGERVQAETKTRDALQPPRQEGLADLLEDLPATVKLTPAKKADN